MFSACPAAAGYRGKRQILPTSRPDRTCFIHFALVDAAFEKKRLATVINGRLFLKRAIGRHFAEPGFFQILFHFPEFVKMRPKIHLFALQQFPAVI